MTKALYKCTQQELYTLCTLAWNNCSHHLAPLSLFSSKYNPALVAANHALIQQAKEIPGLLQRNLNQKLLRVQLTTHTKTILHHFQKLKLYIATAYPPGLQAIHITTAGQPHYRAACHHNWEAVEALISHAVTFALDNAAQLSANDNMPPDFPAQLSAIHAGFTPVHISFLNTEQAVTIATTQKITANNNLFIRLMALLHDGRRVFISDPAILSLFTYSHLLYLIRGAGTAGLHGIITSALSTVPIPQAVITIGTHQYTATTNTDGKYHISPIASASYDISISAPGHHTLLITAYAILTGTISTLNIQLVPST